MEKTIKKLSENILDKFSMDFLRNQVLKNAYGNDDTVIAKLDPRVLIGWYLFFGLVFHPLINSTFWRAMYQQLFLLIHQCHQDCISNGTQSVLHLFLQNICRYDS